MNPFNVTGLDMHHGNIRSTGAWLVAGGAARFGGWLPLRGGVALLRLWRRRARQRRELAALPPRLRRDIGLTEARAAAEARKPFWRP